MQPWCARAELKASYSSHQRNVIMPNSYPCHLDPTESDPLVTFFKLSLLQLPRLNTIKMENIVFSASARPSLFHRFVLVILIAVNKQHILLWILSSSVQLSDKMVKNVDTISTSKKCLDINEFLLWPLKQRIINTGIIEMHWLLPWGSNSFISGVFHMFCFEE